MLLSGGILLWVSRNVFLWSRDRERDREYERERDREYERRNATAMMRCVVKLSSRLELVHTTKHKSCHLLLLICMLFDDQSAPNETRSLCERKGKKEKQIHKKNSPRMFFAGRLVV